MHFPRSAGILLHPTSLPGAFGIGDLGSSCGHFIQFLKECNLHLWQILPLGPTGYGNSPYQTLSAFAGNPLLISPEELAKENLVTDADLQNLKGHPETKVDFFRVIALKEDLIRRAHDRYLAGHAPNLKQDFDTFCHQNCDWVDDYALFRALKNRYNHSQWTRWPINLRRREQKALQRSHEEMAHTIELFKFEQFLFSRQWHAVKKLAHENGVEFIGDIPIFIAHDSSDCWAHQHMFDLTEDGETRLGAGVPPDYFSETGQLWGNPVYHWDRMAESGFEWWVNRLRTTLTLVDRARIDHFRGFDAYWAVPAGHENAIHGEWKPGPGKDFFKVIAERLGELPIIAEDLGVITDTVRDLRDHFDFPGMKILQFAFGDANGTNDFLPHNYEKNCVVYPGTHDNDTSQGWFQSLSADANNHGARESRALILKYLNKDNGTNIHWDLAIMAFSSIADTAIIPLQDILGLGTQARMNLPGVAENNWEWRFSAQQLTDEIRDKLRSLVHLYNRNHTNL